MKLLLPLFIFFLFSTSCSNSNKVKIPADVLCQDTMVAVIADVHLTQASHQMSVPIDSGDTSTLTSFRYVWKKHHISEAEYNKSLDFYSHHPHVLSQIYEDVLKNLSKEKAELSGKYNSK